MRELASRFQAVKGVGPCLTRVVLAYCPDIGEFTDGGIAKMCGDAPIDYESCTIKKKAKPKRGRRCCVWRVVPDDILWLLTAKRKVCGGGDGDGFGFCGFSGELSMLRYIPPVIAVKSGYR